MTGFIIITIFVTLDEKKEVGHYNLKSGISNVQWLYYSADNFISTPKKNQNKSIHLKNNDGDQVLGIGSQGLK